MSFLYNKFLLLVAALVFLNGCAVTHLGGPSAVVPIVEVETSYDILRDIEYAQREEISLKGDLYLPQGSGPFPAVLAIHGGGWTAGDPSMMESVAKRLASRGFAVFNISYRLAPKDVFPAQIEDCKDAVRWLRSNAAIYKIDPKNIGALGYSAGGHLAALLGVLPSGSNPAEDEDLWRVQAVVSGGAPHNMLMYPYSEAIVALLGTTIDKDPEIFLQSSPVHHVDAGDPPTFMYHGTWDMMVDPRHTMQMKEALDRAGVANEIYLVKGLGHIPMFLFDDGAIDAAISFLDRYLRRK